MQESETSSNQSETKDSPEVTETQEPGGAPIQKTPSDIEPDKKKKMKGK
jgi:hypothetical protein